MIQLSNEDYAALVAERDALLTKAATLDVALKRAQELVLHIEDVIPDEAFHLIDTARWNAVTAGIEAVPSAAESRETLTTLLVQTVVCLGAL